MIECISACMCVHALHVLLVWRHDFDKSEIQGPLEKEEEEGPCDYYQK